MSILNLSQFLQKHKLTVLSISIAVISLITFLKIFDEFYRLVFIETPNGAIDLRVLKRGIGLWFENRPIIQELKSAVYPPASYAMLWPFIGWMKFPFSRIIMACSLILILILFSKFSLKHSLSKSTEASAIALLIPLCLNATGVVIGNGQLTIHLLLMILIAIFMLKNNKNYLSKEILISILIVFSLIKPSLTAPFIWLVLFIFPNHRVILMTILLYFVITFVSYYFRETEINEVVKITKQAYHNIIWGTISGSDTGGYANLHSLFSYIGIERFNIIGSFLLSLIFGIWVFLNKKADLWLLLAVTALFSRFWMYHRVYDDFLLAIPMISLIRIINTETIKKSIHQMSLILFILTILAMMIPASLQFISPYSFIFIWGHTILWLVLIVYFIILIKNNIRTDFYSQ